MIEVVRLVAYVVGSLFAMVLAGQLFRLEIWLARLLAFAMVVWAINCGIQFMVLLSLVQTGEFPPWRDAGMTANALLLAIAPVWLYIGFYRRHNGHE